LPHFSFLIVNFYLFIVLIYVLLILLFLTFIIILGFVIYRKKVASNKALWHQNIAPVILQAIFLEEDGGDRVEVTYKFKMLFQDPRFRRYAINELIKAKDNFSGSSASSLQTLYESLDLDGDSFRELHNPKWHIKAKGIQELGIMKQAKYRKEIFWLANNKHELVRNEAQCAMVSFFGFSGLSFLNVIEYPMSQWHQVQLLHKLNDVKPETFEALKTWMQSSNESVIVFAIKLATLYNCYGVYTNVVNCLKHPGVQVKISALEYLKQMPQEDTPDRIISNYYSENINYKLAVINALKDIGTEKQISFLVKELHNKNNDVKAAAANSLSVLHPLGHTFFKTYLLAEEKPWKEIFLQITHNRIA